MRVSSLLFLAGLAAAVPTPAPIDLPSLSDISDSVSDLVNPKTDVDLTDSVLLFDAPAFQSPTNSNVWLSPMRSFVYLRQPDLGIVASAFEKFLTKTLNIKIGDKLSTLEERIKLFATIPNPGEEVAITLACGSEVTLPETPLSGMIEATVPVCSSDGPIIANVTVGSLDDRDIGAQVFPSAPEGWGVISDVDDTIKISHVLDKLESAKKAFLEPLEPVPGMPELYQQLQGQLQDSQFVYLSGSPFQFQPMLHDLIHNLMKVPGPLILQNFTFTDPAGILDLVGGKTKEYKLSQIERIKEWYPKKQFLAVGDSGQSDPEVYGEAVRTHGKEWMGCIWIRFVGDEGADNSDARFAKAFEGVEEGRWRVFKDPAELMEIDVAGGKC